VNTPDLFRLASGPLLTRDERKSITRKTLRPNGYAKPPGSGPAGETCKSCTHIRRVAHAKVYRKCGLLEAHWTHGPGSDILAGSPACSLWQKPEAKP